MVFLFMVFLGICLCAADLMDNVGGFAFAARPFPPVSARFQEFVVVERFTGHFWRLLYRLFLRLTLAMASLAVGSAYVMALSSSKSLRWHLQRLAIHVPIADLQALQQVIV